MTQNETRATLWQIANDYDRVDLALRHADQMAETVEALMSGDETAAARLDFLAIQYRATRESTTRTFPTC